MDELTLKKMLVLTKILDDKERILFNDQGTRERLLQFISDESAEIDPEEINDERKSELRKPMNEFLDSVKFLNKRLLNIKAAQMETKFKEAGRIAVILRKLQEMSTDGNFQYRNVLLNYSSATMLYAITKQGELSEDTFLGEMLFFRSLESVAEFIVLNGWA